MIAAALAMAFVPGRAQANNILGIDVSAYQGGSINWTSVHNDGVKFAFSRATTGYEYSEDSTYPDFLVGGESGVEASSLRRACSANGNRGTATIYSEPPVEKTGNKSKARWSPAGISPR